MKRDVKVGLFVAVVVCSVAALLLGGGMVGRRRVPTRALRMSFPREVPGALPADLADAVLPPAEAEDLADELMDSDLLFRDDGLLEDDGFFEDDGLFGDDGVALETADLLGGFLLEEDPGAAFRAAGAVAEPPSNLLEAGPSASGPAPEGTPEETDGLEIVELTGVVELTEEELLARALAVAEEASNAPAGPVGAGRREVSVPAPAKYVYIMKPGDSFWTVSKKIYGPGKYFKDVQLANPDVDPKKLRPGDRIAVPEIPDVPMRRDLLATPEELEEKRKSRVYLAQDKIHEVQPGEVLEDIALKFYGFKHKWPHIVKANPDLDPRKMRPGDKIVVPALTE
jgi:nucleoid-associated protein YgaU